MDEFTFQQCEQGGVTVSIIQTLFSSSDLDRGKFTTLINLHDTGFDTSFESTSSLDMQVQSLLNQYSSEIKVKDLANCFSDSTKAQNFKILLHTVYQAFAASLHTSTPAHSSTPRAPPQP